MTIDKRKIKEEPIILLPKHQDEEEQQDLSWMIRDDKILKKPVKKLSKRKKK